MTYKYPHVAAQSAPSSMRVTLNHPSLAEGGPINKFAKFDVLAGSYAETWSSESTGDCAISFALLCPVSVEVLMMRCSAQPLAGDGDDRARGEHDEGLHGLVPVDVHRRVVVDGGPEKDESVRRRRGWLALHEFEERASEGNTTRIEGF